MQRKKRQTNPEDKKQPKNIIFFVLYQKLSKYLLTPKTNKDTMDGFESIRNIFFDNLSKANNNYLKAFISDYVLRKISAQDCVCECFEQHLSSAEVINIKSIRPLT